MQAIREFCVSHLAPLNVEILHLEKKHFEDNVLANIWPTQLTH